MKKKIGRINIHSAVDVITNSSTMLFCTVKGKEKAIEAVLEEIKDEFGCTAVEFSIDQAEDKDNDYELITNQYEISYDYEMHHQPCNMMLDKIKEKLNIVEVA